MARRSDHSREEIRQMALDAAEAIITEGGYKGLSTRKVAATIGYTAGTLYLVFEDLEDLVRQLNGRTLDALHAWLRARQPQDGDPRAQLLALADSYIAYAEAETPRWNLLFEYVTEQGNELPDWYLAKLSRVFGLAETALAPLADRRSARQIQQAARVLWAGVHGICTLKIRHRMELAGGQMARMLIDNFLIGFQRQGGEQQ